MLLNENFLKLSFQRGKNNKKSLSQTENCYDWFNFYVFEGLFSCFFRCYQLEEPQKLSKNAQAFVSIRVNIFLWTLKWCPKKIVHYATTTEILSEKLILRFKLHIFSVLASNTPSILDMAIFRRYMMCSFSYILQFVGCFDSEDFNLSTWQRQITSIF